MASPYPETRVVAVGAFNSAGLLLLGLRQDVNLYTCPGGHLDDGETPPRGAIRELWEETGLTPKSLSYLGDGLVRLSDEVLIRVYCFRAEIPDGQVPTGENDPDQECAQWKWVDVSLGSLPLQYDKYLYHPNDVLLKFLGLQRGLIQNDLDQLQPDVDTVKVIFEQSGMAPCPIEGSAKYVCLELLRRLPEMASQAEPDDYEGLALAINESKAAFVAFGDELNAPRHRYKTEQWSEEQHEDPWRREGDL